MPRMRDRKQRLLVLWLLATTLAGFDLWLNLLVPSPDWALHHRSALWAIGCTVVLAGEGAVVGADVRGLAPGTREKTRHLRLTGLNISL